MSSLHFEVENFGSYAEVRDLRSTNRTWLNNNFVTSAPLKHGDRLRAGKTVMAVEIEHTAIVDEAGLTPKPPLLESTSQLRCRSPRRNRWLCSLQALLAIPCLRMRSRGAKSWPTSMPSYVPMSQPRNHRTIGHRWWWPRPFIALKSLCRRLISTCRRPLRYRLHPHRRLAHTTVAIKRQPIPCTNPKRFCHRLKFQPELAAVPVAAPPAMPSPVVPLPPASRPSEPMQPAALKPQAPAVSPPYRTTSVGEARRQSHSPIESVEFSPPVERRQPRPLENGRQQSHCGFQLALLRTRC